MNLYKQINDWLSSYPQLNSWVYFNATPYIVGAVALNSVAGDRIKKKYINGKTLREILFAIDMVKDYDQQGTSEINLSALDEVNNFADWIESQKNSGNYPDFGQDNTIKKIEVLTNVPSLLVNNEQGLAKYQFQVRIEYLRK